MRQHSEATVKRFTGLPEGVTVRKMTDAAPVITRPRNKIEQAALCGDVEAAKAMIADALGMDANSKLARIHFSEQYRWARIAPDSRLVEIASWLRAEAFEVMDLIEAPAISTIGD